MVSMSEEASMRRFCSGLVAVALLAGGGALAQTPGGPAATIETEKQPLSAEKQLEVKTSLARYERALRPGQELPRLNETLSAGATVPAGIELISLPQDTVTEVPTTTTYRFVLMREGIAVVDPETRKIVQVID
jgi:Protein of unknown function (DUF1236)